MMKLIVNSGRTAILFAVSAIVLALTFQNCSSGFNSSNLEEQISESSLNTDLQKAICLFNGQVITAGGIVTAYQTASVPLGQSCASETRSCANGELSGSFAY